MPILFKNKNVVVMGLGLHGGGVGVVKFLAKQGTQVLVTDLKTKKELKESIAKLRKYKVKYILGRHRIGDFKNADLIIKNPGVPKESKYLQIARKNSVPIETDIGLFFELCPSKKIIGVTGTKGKSTVATLIAKLLATKYHVVLAGNIRTSALEVLPKISKNTIVVLELSSWQLEDLEDHKKNPWIAVITNIMQDHLNRYRGIKDYIEAKKLIFKFQKVDDYLILNREDKIVRKFSKPACRRGRKAKSKIIFYSKNQTKKYIKYIKIIGEHNLSNISATIATAKILKIKDKNIKKALKNFKGIEGRIEFIKEVGGVKYYNDTTATTPDATIAALNSFPEKQNIILIGGGTDKNLNFKELAKLIFKKVKLLILLPGTATQKLKKEIAKFPVQLIEVKDMRDAIKKAKKQAEKGDAVLLSPGCASFGLFQHEFDRGKQFQKCIKNL
jgi:UDP-N-acetylmuramoylalanine--D-glutamate ligase